MTRRGWTYLLMFAMLWQTLGSLVPTAQTKLARHVTNQLTHAQQLDHHHHTDESLHMEAAADQTTHQHANEGVQPVGLPAVEMVADAEAPRSPPKVASASDIVSITLDVPLRPPPVCA